MADLHIKIDQNSDTYGEIEEIKELLAKKPWYKAQKITAKMIVALAIDEYRDKLKSEN